MPDKLAIFVLNIGVVGADVHELADAAAALADGDVLKKLAYLVEHHDGDALAEVAQRYRAYRGDGHKEVLVEGLAVLYALHGLHQRLIADYQIGDKVQRELEPPVHGRKLQRYDQNHRRDYPVQQLLLFLVHVLASGALYLCLRKRSRSRPQRACSF